MSKELLATEFWRLQKEASLTNKQCAEYLEANIRTIGRWRVANPLAPKTVILAMQHYINLNSVESVKGES